MASDAYTSWEALDRAVKDSVDKADDTSLSVSDRYQQFIFDRFLSRVFEADDSPWLLKGGTGMLARVAGARRTRDVDLSTTSAELEEAIEDLQTRIEHSELGDHLTFIVSSEKATGLGPTQPETATRQLAVECFAGRKRITRFHVDVAVGPAPTGKVEIVNPVSRIELSRPIATRKYRLYPLVDSIAEKVCATMSTAYPVGISSRTKDLVDLVIISRTQSVNLRALQIAIATHRARMRLPEFPTFQAPITWAERFRADAARTPADGMEFTEAVELVQAFVDPALSGDPIAPETVWIPTRRSSGVA